MPTKFSGIKAVSYSVAGANSYTTIGTPNADADVKDEASSVETSKGTKLYAGIKRDATFTFTDLTSFTTLETGMKANTEYDIKVTYMDDTSEVIATSVPITVVKEIKGKVGEINGFKLTFSHYLI